jgi:hypothetical protein
MSNGEKIVAILKVFHSHDNMVECHSEHDILMFCETNKKVEYADELKAAGLVRGPGRGP